MKLSSHALMVAAMVIAPFTLLRLGFVGLGEIFVIIVFLIQLAKGVRRSQIGHFVLTKFWVAYLALAMAGLVVNTFLLENQTSTTRQVVFDLAAYLFILATCFSLERLVSHTTFDVQRFVRDFVFWSGLVFSTLFVTSLFTGSLFGLPLKYYDYFVPWADNLHQVSMTLVPLPFLALAAARTAGRGIRRHILYLLAPATAYMAISTGSSKAVLAMYVGAFALAYSFSLKRFGAKWFVQVNLLFAVLAIAVLAATSWARLGEILFEENDLGGVRNFLYSHAVEIGLESPLVGRGPGPHLELLGSYMDAHQTWLTAFLQAGIPGLLLFSALVIYLGRRLAYEPALLAAFSTLVVYAAGGDILRRLPAWIVIFAVAYFAPREMQSRRAVSGRPMAASASP